MDHVRLDIPYHVLPVKNHLCNRYLAICYPFKHKEFVGKNVTIAIVLTYINGMAANCLCFVQVKAFDIFLH